MRGSGMHSPSPSRWERGPGGEGPPARHASLRIPFSPCLRALTLVAALLACLTTAGCQGGRTANGSARPVSANSGGAVRFTDVTDTAGIRFRHTNGASGRYYLSETMGSGCAFLDYDNDGKLDLFLVNSGRLPGFKEKGPFTSALYRNRGNGVFEDVTQQAGLDVELYGMGAAVGDYDGDGFQDIYLTGVGPNRLFRNQGDGTFADVTAKAGVGDPHFSTSAAWFDYDRDGHLDLYVGNYCHWSPATNKVCQGKDGDYICPPDHYSGDSGTLYRNNGNGAFTDVTKKAGVYSAVGKNLGVLVWDANGDGWLDLVVANDLEPNLLFENNTDGTFTERGVEAGIAYSNEGKPRAGMGIDTADTANNGRESVLIGNNKSEGLGQFLTDGQGSFTDVAGQTGLLGPSLPFLTFGVAYVDYDGDGLKDVIAANGHVNGVEKSEGYAMPMLAFHNQGSGQFHDSTAELGPALSEKRVWRGLACGDIDNDGDPDLLVSVCNGKPALLRNDGGNARPWLQVKAIAAGKNRQGLGTKVTVTAGGMHQSGWIRSGSSYCSQNELKAFFGLGTAQQAEQVELLFPSGKREVLQNVKAGQLIVVQEGKGLVAQGAPGAVESTLLPQIHRRVAARP
jgi:enediyne biosynthesis protein E4